VSKPDARTIIAIVGAVMTALQSAFPSSHWMAGLTAVATAVFVHLTAPSSSTTTAPSSGANGHPVEASCTCGESGCPGPLRST
jgi:multisubunit Na+/H+ antiporter MnhG subunit